MRTTESCMATISFSQSVHELPGLPPSNAAAMWKSGTTFDLSNCWSLLIRICYPEVRYSSTLRCMFVSLTNQVLWIEVSRCDDTNVLAILLYPFGTGADATKMWMDSWVDGKNNRHYIDVTSLILVMTCVQLCLQDGWMDGRVLHPVFSHL